MKAVAALFRHLSSRSLFGPVHSGDGQTNKDFSKFTRILFETDHLFIQTKTHGVGQPTILKFYEVVGCSM